MKIQDKRSRTMEHSIRKPSDASLFCNNYEDYSFEFDVECVVAEAPSSITFDEARSLIVS